MTDPILVAIHPEGESRETIRLAVCAARVFERPLLLGGIWVPRDAVPAAPQVGAFLEVMEPGLMHDELRRHLETVRATVPTDVASQVAVATAPSVAAGVEALVSDHGARLVVLGATHRTLLERVAREDPELGAVRRLAVAVLLAASDPRDAITATAPKLVGVAWDDTPASRNALGIAADLALRAGAELRVFHVFPPVVALTPALLPPVSPVVMLPPDAEVLASRASGLHHRVTADIQAAAAALGIAPPTDIVFREGAVAASLEAASTEVDLLVTGSRQAGVLRRIAAGSVSERLVHHAGCPLLVVPQSATTPGFVASSTAEAVA